MLRFRSPVDFLLLFNFSNIINMKDKCLRKKIRCFNKYFGAFFLPFRAKYGFPVVVHGRPEGRKEGRKETCVRAGSLCENATRAGDPL